MPTLRYSKSYRSAIVGMTVIYIRALMSRYFLADRSENRYNSPNQIARKSKRHSATNLLNADANPSLHKSLPVLQTLDIWSSPQFSESLPAPNSSEFFHYSYTDHALPAAATMPAPNHQLNYPRHTRPYPKNYPPPHALFYHHVYFVLAATIFVPNRRPSAGT